MFTWKKMMAVLVVSVLMVGMFAGCSSDAASSDEDAADVDVFKVALVAEGAVNDGGWNALALSSLKQIESELGAEIAYSEKVQRAQMEEVLRTYAREGYDIIYGHGFQFSEPMETVSKEFPEVTFIPVNGYVSGENLFSTNFRFGELGYFTGLTAGQITESNTVGVVAAMEAPTVVADVDTFIQGVKEVNPDAEVMVSYIGSWEDIPKAKESSQAQIDKGADVVLVMGNSFSIGVFQACEDAGAYSIGWVDDQSSMSESVVTCGLQNISQLYLQMAKNAMEGTLDSSVAYNFGMADGAQSLSPFSAAIPTEVQDSVNQAIQDYLDGSLTLELLY